MGIYPSQLRTVDPYASYHSNVVNKLTRLVTRGNNCIHSKYAVDVAVDSTSPDNVIIVSAGECFKDDVLIELTAPHSLDIRDTSNYAPGAVVGAGTWYVVLAYVYSKSRPAPQASIQILTENIKANIAGGTYLFLKALTVTVPGAGATITAIHDIDPTLPIPLYQPYARRNFTQLYIGLEFTLPSFTQLTDESRVIYVQDEDEVYYGTSTHWEPLSAARAAIDTTNSSVGCLAYVDSTAGLLNAIATDLSTLADCVVTSYGASGGAGMVRLVGSVSLVLLETTVWGAVNVGDKMYLSNIEAGTVTNIEPAPYAQNVGVCTVAPTGLDPNIIGMWFNPSGSGGVVQGGGYGNANSFMYRFSSNTGDSDPGIGYLRLNGVPGAATFIYIDLQTAEAGNPNINPWLLTLDDSSSTVKGHIKVSKLNHPEIFVIYEISGALVTPAGYRKIPVTYVTDNGTIANGDYVVFSYSRTGDKGDQGTAYLHTQGGSNTSWTVNHNLAKRWCIVQVINLAGYAVIPSTIFYNNTNTLTITFATSTDGYAVVMGAL